MKKNRIINGLLISAFFFSVTLASAQTRMPDELNTAAIREQIEYVEDHTRIYDNFRAIREDIFQKLNKNILDSLTAVKNKVAELKGDTANLISRTDSLNVLLTSTRSQLEEVTATKNKIRVFGMEINKTTYNTIMWILVGGLILLMVLGFLVFKRNLVVLLRTEKDLKELNEEFATYTQTSRIAREKVEMDLFRANQKLKGLV